MSWSTDTPVVELTLVRHGQASYLEGDDYDRLSAVGERQGHELGRYWRGCAAHFDLVFSGPAKRHRDTARIVAGAFRAGNPPWPGAKVLAEFDEFPGEDVVRRLGPLLAERHDHISEMARAFHRAEDKQVRKRALDVLFHEVALRWVDGEVEDAAVETWPAFVARIGRGVDHIRRASKPGDRVVVFTSAGPTAVVASLALGMPPRNTLELAFSPRNGSFSEFRLRPDSIGLSSFNRFPHLDEPELLTYR